MLHRGAPRARPACRRRTGGVPGALGSQLQSIDEIREAAYGHHQRRRSDQESNRDGDEDS